MKLLHVALIGCLFASPLLAVTPAPKQPPSSLDKQIEALKLDVPRIREIMKLVATRENEPTKQIHDEFWGLVLTRIHADPKALQAGFTKGFNAAIPIQIAFWNSLLLSAKNHRIVITKQYAAMRNDFPKAAFTSDYIKVQNAMLKAAATGQPYTFRNGKKTLITVQVANRTLGRIHSMKARFDKLLDPNWQK